LPRVLGIEAVGVIHEAPGGEFQKGDVVATCMGGLGREVDGGYAEYTLVKTDYARLIETKVPWNVLGALPEMLQTSWGALNRNLAIQAGETLLIRGGTYFCWVGGGSECEEPGINCSGHYTASGQREAATL
jgi:NADPH:quinone reductase-like Zn-dependent oxidoreductase